MKFLYCNDTYLTLEVTNDNFHGVHRLELYIVAFKKIIASLILVAKIYIRYHCVAKKPLYYNITITSTLQYAFMQILLSEIQQKNERKYEEFTLLLNQN